MVPRERRKDPASRRPFSCLRRVRKYTRGLTAALKAVNIVVIIIAMGRYRKWHRRLFSFTSYAYPDGLSRAMNNGYIKTTTPKVGIGGLVQMIAPKLAGDSISLAILFSVLK